jgi:hypothetical protein
MNQTTTSYTAAQYVNANNMTSLHSAQNTADNSIIHNQRPAGRHMTVEVIGNALAEDIQRLLGLQVAVSVLPYARLGDVTIDLQIQTAKSDEVLNRGQIWRVLQTLGLQVLGARLS